MSDGSPDEDPSSDGCSDASALATSPAAAPATTLPISPAASQLPVVDLIGLRFSLHHLRLVGYGLMAVWLGEMGGLLTAPDLAAIGSRLYSISQFLDLSPILLVSIGLIAYQGGLRRSAIEILLLPLLLSLLPLLSAFHFFLAPVSLANAITLIQKQQEISNDRIERIDRQFDRASTILRESDSIDSLLDGLQRIPGLQVRLPKQASVQEARREVRTSLERERGRLRQRIRGNLSTTREAYLRRAITNSGLAVLVGLVLWGLHNGALREMEQAIPFLDWVLLQGELNQSPDVLRELLRFQRACVALGWFSLLERSVRLVGRVVRPQKEEEQPEDLRVGTIDDETPPAAYPPPFAPGRLSILSGMRPTLFPSGAPPQAGIPVVSPDDEDLDPDDPDLLQPEEGEPSLPFWERRRQERDLRRAREALRRMADSSMFQDLQQDPRPEPTPGVPMSDLDGSGQGDLVPDPGLDLDLEEDPRDPHDLSASELRARQRDVRRSRDALRRLADQEFLEMIGHVPPEPEALPPPPPREPGPLSRLWRWFVTHL